MTTTYTLMVTYVWKNTRQKVSYSFPTYKEFNKATNIVRDAARYSNTKSNIIEYSWEFSKTVFTAEQMLSFMKNTTDIKVKEIQ